MLMDAPFAQGEIWSIRLDPGEGAELRKTRPCVIVSRGKINQYLETVTVIPFTTGTKHRTILHLDVSASSGNGLEKDSYLKIHQIRTVSKTRLQQKIGFLEPEYLVFIRTSLEEYLWGGM